MRQWKKQENWMQMNSSKSMKDSLGVAIMYACYIVKMFPSLSLLFTLTLFREYHKRKCKNFVEFLQALYSLVCCVYHLKTRDLRTKVRISKCGLEEVKNGLSSLMSVTSDTQINENLKDFSEKRRSLISERETTHDFR